MVFSGTYSGVHYYKNDNTTNSLQTHQQSDGGAFTDLNVFPTTAAEQSAMWYRDNNTNPTGITCMELFFYAASYDPGDISSSMEIIDIRGRWEGSNKASIDHIFRVRLDDYGGQADDKTRIQVRVGYTSSAEANNPSTSNDVRLLTMNTPEIQDILRINEWYHLVVRLNRAERAWECYLGHMGVDSSGATVGAVTKAVLSDTTTNNNPHDGNYMKWTGGTALDAGPCAAFFPFQTRALSEGKGKYCIGNRAQGNQQGNRAFDGGLAEIRFWKSSVNELRPLATIEGLKDVAVVHEDYPELVHCLRLNEGAVSQANFVNDFYKDVGQHDITFERARTINSAAGYPYDITSQADPGVGGNEWEVAGTCAGESVYLDFYGQHWADDIDGNPIYREQPGLPLVAGGGPGGIENYDGGEGIRAIVRDYIRPDLLYYLPGTGVVEVDSVGNGIERYSLVLPRFDILSGHAAVFQNVYLFDNNILLNEQATEYEYFANADLGPYAFTEQDTGTISLNLFAE